MSEARYNVWTMDFDSPHEAHIHAIQEFLLSYNTPFQKLDVVITYGYGKALLLDGRLQSTEKDEYIYHESLVHPSMVSGDTVEKVLIIGGGEGSTLREVLRYPSVREAVMVDIDEEVVQACREHLGEFHQGAFDDPRSRVIIGDGRKFVQETGDRFDVVIVDISEPMEGGPAYNLYTIEFYRLVERILKPGGRVVTQGCTSSLSMVDTFSVICNTMKGVFGAVSPYQCFVPSFGCTWGFSMWGGRGVRVESLDVDRALEGSGIFGLRFYDGMTHRSMFSLPKDVRQVLSSEERIFTDEDPPSLF